jgi:uncharacterized protein YdhG (YjbR/CyaY superfamily)
MKPTTVDEYLQSFPETQRRPGEQFRQWMIEELPGAQEVISYGMPAYRYQRVVLYFGLWNHHLGLYPTGTAIRHFAEQLKPYVHSKGTVQFPLDQPLPEELIRAMARYRREETLAAARKVKKG